MRGELWIAPEVLLANGFSQDLKGLVEMASSMEADICFLPYHDSLLISDLKELKTLANDVGLNCALTIDGPFQSLTQQRDLLTIFEEMGRRPLNFQEKLTKEMWKIVEKMRRVEELGIELAILCDDLAYKARLYFSPANFRKYLLPLYRILASEFSSKKITMGWHSDGNVSAILSDLVNCGFRFFSMESECVNLLAFKLSYGNRVTLIGGIRTAWLLKDRLDREQQQECLKEIKNLAAEGGFILASSCGLFSPESLHRLKEIYSLTKDLATLPSESE